MNPFFISHGDFLFPLDPKLLIAKHFFLWSFQNGAANPDGLIRVFMRLPMILVAYFFGSLAASYFLILLTLVVCFLSFYLFLQELLRVRSVPVKILCALLFAINPIFLGNFAKIGLVQAAAMLPLSLMLLNHAFGQRSVKWLIPWIFTLNASFVHPFTLAVNLAINGAFFLYQVMRAPPFFFRSLHKFLGIGILTLLLNAYFILPLISLGSVDKSVLTQDLGDSPPDYTQLIHVAANKNLAESLSLSKSVFLDFQFFDENYTIVYFSALIVLYGLLFVAYFLSKKHLSLSERTTFFIFLLFFLLLIIATTTSIPLVAQILTRITTFPGGWMFRAPLKWQLYLPMLLFGLVAIVLKYLSTRTRALLLAGFFIAGITMNSFIARDLFTKLLIPRQITQLDTLWQMELEKQNLLSIQGPNCASRANENPEFFTELNMVLISKNLQVKKVNQAGAADFFWPHFDYVITCEVEENMLQKLENNFLLAARYQEDSVRIYRNNSQPALITATPALYRLEDTSNLDAVGNFVLDQHPFAFVPAPVEFEVPTFRLHGLFTNLTSKNLFSGFVEDSEFTPELENGELSVKKTDLVPEFIGNSVLFDTTQSVATPSSEIPVALSPQKPVFFHYLDPNYQPQNLIPNGSFETGPWQQVVGDCYNFDNSPQIGMSVQSPTAAEGKNALTLNATRHVACTDITVPIQAHTRYLFTFSYQGDPAKLANYYLSFNDPDNTGFDDKTSIHDRQWHTYSQTFTPPAGATELTIILYGQPLQTGVEGVTRYDEVGLYAIPDIENMAFVTEGPTASAEAQTTVKTEYFSPTKTLLSITSDGQPFYLVSKDSYHPKWNLLEPHSGRVVREHFLVNNFQNGWYIDPAVLCSQAPACRINPDGTYTINFMMLFSPQKWFYRGMAISLLAGLGCVVFWIADWKKSMLLKQHGRYVSRRS